MAASPHITIKNSKANDRAFMRRFITAFAITVFFALGLLTRLVYLQLYQNSFYSTLSTQNLLSIVPIQANRGLIFDRNGVLLAENIPIFSLTLIPEKVGSIDTTLANLKPLINLTPKDIKHFKRNLLRHHRYDPVDVKLQLTDSEMARFYVNQYRFPGVRVESRMMRHYPLGAVTGSVVGYVGRMNAGEKKAVDEVKYRGTNFIGKIGIEKYYESELHGTVGAEQAEINASGKIIRTLHQVAPQPGQNIYLTIDSKLQAFAEEALGDNSGAIIAIQPKTGQVLAMVTNPRYDPNLFVNGISQEDFSALMNAPEHPLYDRSIRGLYSPASTIKPTYALMGLSDGVITPDFKIYDPGWFRVPGTEHIFHDWKFTGHGYVNVAKAVTQSCDTFFYQLATNMGIKRIDEALTAFGFGKLTGIDVPNELAGIVPTPEWKRTTKGQNWYTGDTVNLDIGQGLLLVTPLQLAQNAATIAMHGQRFKPQLLLKSQIPGQQWVKHAPQPDSSVPLTNPDYWGLVIDAMTHVIDGPHGTAMAFGHHSGYQVAGKTGTAQVFGKQRDEERSRMNIPRKLRNHHLFINFAPVKNPEIALAVIVEHASFADRIAGNVTRFYMKELNEQKKLKPLFIEPLSANLGATKREQ